jgi:TolB-like protein/Flp pilus assembly protein TadD
VFLGRFQFTNIKVSVELYAVSNEGITVPGKIKLKGKGVSALDLKRRVISRVTIFAFALIAIVSVILYFTLFSKAKQARENRIAVMPFKNLSPNADDALFSEGISEDILTQLSKIGSFQVISFSTTKQLSDSALSASELANAIGADFVIEGSVRRAADKLRITAQLVDAGTAQNVWAETFDRESDKVFEIQSEIARYVAGVLKTKLSASEEQQLSKKPTGNMAAYEFYLKGRDHYSHFSSKDNDLAISDFKMAISLDSTYALAWAGLGDAFSQKVRLGLEKAWLDSGRAASTRAIVLDSTASEGYKALANYYFLGKRYSEGVPLLQKAIALNPNNAQAIGNLGTSYFVLGQYTEALTWQVKAARLSPTNFVPYYITGWIYRLLGKYNDADQWLAKALTLRKQLDIYREIGYLQLAQGKRQKAAATAVSIVALDTGGANNYQLAGLLMQMAGRNGEAESYYRKAIQIQPSAVSNPDFYGTVGLGCLLIKNGQKAEGEAMLNQALTAYQHEIASGSMDDDPRLYASAVCAVLGQKEKALQYLQLAIASNWVDFAFTENNPWFDSIRNEPEYKTVISTLQSKMRGLAAQVATHELE